MEGCGETIAVILPKQVRERKDRIKRETHGKHKATLSKPTHISSKTSLIHSLTHKHNLVIKSVPHTYSKHSWWSRGIHSLPSLLFLVPASCLGWPLSSPSHLNIPDTWLDCTTWTSGAGGAQQHHCCLWDRMDSTGSLYTPMSFSSVRTGGCMTILQCMRKCCRMFWESDRERDSLWKTK